MKETERRCTVRPRRSFVPANPNRFSSVRQVFAMLEMASYVSAGTQERIGEKTKKFNKNYVIM
jgi:hypothetical protein